MKFIVPTLLLLLCLQRQSLAGEIQCDDISAPALRAICSNTDLRTKYNALTSMFIKAEELHPNKRNDLRSHFAEFAKVVMSCGDIKDHVEELRCLDDALLAEGDWINVRAGGSADIAPFSPGDFHGLTSSASRPPQSEPVSPPTEPVQQSERSDQQASDPTLTPDMIRFLHGYFGSNYVDGLVRTYYIASLCEQAGAQFSKDDVAYLQRTIKYFFDLDGISKDRRDEAWENAKLRVARGPSLTQKNCSDVYGAAKFLFPGMVRVDGARNPL